MRASGQVASPVHDYLRSLVLASVIAAASVGCGSDKAASPTGPQGAATSITITPSIPMIAPSGTQQFIATAYYSGGGTADVTSSVEWSSANDAVLSIGNTAGTKGMATRNTDASYQVTATMGSISGTLRASAWSTALASTLRFDGDWIGTGTGSAIGRIVADASALYWAAFDASAGVTGGSIGKVDKAGGTAVTLASGLGGINAVASDGAHVYWTEFAMTDGAGAVKRVPVTGGAVEVLASGTPAGSVYDVFFPGGIDVDASFVYWGEGSGGGAIRRVPKAGGTVVDLGRGQGFGPTALSVDATYGSGITNNGGTGVAARLPLAGGSVEVLASGLANAADVASDGSALFLPELVAPNGRIVRVPVGGVAEPLATALDNPRSISLQGGFVYYTGATGSGAARQIGVWKVPTTGGTPTLVVYNAGNADGFDPFSLVTDATHIYFVDVAGSASSRARVLSAPRE